MTQQLTIKEGICGSFQRRSIKPPRLEASRSKACENAVRVWPVRCPLSSQERQEINAICAGLLFKRQVGDLRMIQTKRFSRLQQNLYKLSFAIFTQDLVLWSSYRLFILHLDFSTNLNASLEAASGLSNYCLNSASYLARAS